MRLAKSEVVLILAVAAWLVLGVFIYTLKALPMYEEPDPTPEVLP